MIFAWTGNHLLTINCQLNKKPNTPNKFVTKLDVVGIMWQGITEWSLSLTCPEFWNCYFYLAKLYNNVRRLKKSMIFCKKVRLSVKNDYSEYCLLFEYEWNFWKRSRIHIEKCTNFDSSNCNAHFWHYIRITHVKINNNSNNNKKCIITVLLLITFRTHTM